MRQVVKRKQQKKKSNLQKFNTYCSIAFVMLLLLTGTLYSVVQVSAQQGFTRHDSAWYNLDEGMANRKGDTYPYNSDTATVNAVSLDVAYGTTRGLIQYYGEVPYDSCYNGDEATDNFEGIYAQYGTGLHHSTNSSYFLKGDTNNVSGGKWENCENFWGIDPIDYSVTSASSYSKSGDSSDVASTDDGFVTLSGLEAVNAENVKSLRLYALSNSGSGSIWLSNLFYMGMNYLAKFVIWILSLIVSAKNIDTGFILEALHLDDLMAKITSVMIWDNETSHLSIFMGAAIVLFIFGIVAFVWKYATGKDKEQSVLSMVVTALVGMLIVGACLTGRIASLGSSLSNGVTNIMSTVAEAMQGANCFVIDVTDSENTNKIAQMREMALVNKGYIDLQICTQFGVDEVTDLNFTELNFSTLNTADASLVRDHLYGMSSGNTYLEFDNNLGYYYWYANSGASGTKPYRNKTYPETNTVAAQQKLNSMITMLQVAYNKANTTQEQKDNIKGVILALAHPNGWAGMLTMLLYTAILILLMMVTWKYAINVLIGKLELFFGLMGFAFAGPMILSAKPQLVKTGKTIMGMVAVAVIEIFFYGVLFDFILFLVSSLLSTNVLQLLVVLGVLLLLMKFNPYIQEKIKSLLDTVERTVSPNFSNAKRTMKMRARTGMQQAMANYDKGTHIVGYDKDGNAIERANAGNALSKLMHQANNTFLTDATQHQSALKINSQLNADRERNEKLADDAILKASNEKARAVIESVNKETDSKIKAFKSDVSDERSTKYNEDGTYNMDNLSTDEKISAQAYNDCKAKLDEAKNQQALLRQKLASANEMADGAIKSAKIAETESQMKIMAKEVEKITAEVDASKKVLEKQISDNATRKIASQRGFTAEDLEKAGGDDLATMASNAIATKTQQSHKAELQSALQSGIDANKKRATISTGKKIGGKNEVNEAAITESAIYMQQLTELDSGIKMSSNEEARKKTADAVRKAVEYGENAQIHEVQYTGVSSTSRDESVLQAKAELKRAKSMNAVSADEKRRKEESIKAAQEKVNTAKAEAKANRKEAKSDRKEAYGEYDGNAVKSSRASLEQARMMTQLQANIMGKSETTSKPTRAEKREERRTVEALDRDEAIDFGRRGKEANMNQEMWNDARKQDNNIFGNH